MYINWKFLCSLLLLGTPFTVSKPMRLKSLQLSKRVTDSPIPPDFQFIHDYSTFARLSFDMAFVNTIEALKTLALGDFEGRTNTPRFSTTKYPRPVITITSPNGATYKRKYAIWGLVLALNYLAVPSQCGMSHFTFMWHGVAVLKILYDVPSGNPVASIGTSKRDASTISLPTRQMIGRTISPRLDNSPSTSLKLPLNATSLSNARLQVSTKYLGKSKAKLDLVLAILFVLSQAAAFPAHQQVPIIWAPEIQERDCLFHVESSVRSSPPLMTYAWVIEVVSRTANYLIDHHIWQDLEVFAYVDGVLIGTMNFL